MGRRPINPLNAYNQIAWIYDPLSRYFLGKQFIRSKYSYLERIRTGQTVLILGGGTGENLPEIVRRIGAKGRVYFMDASTVMIRRAKRRFQGGVPVNIQFIHSADFSQLSTINPDVILTQYFLDVLSDKKLEILFDQLAEVGDKHTEWIFVDFYNIPAKRWLIRILIGLFNIVVDHPRRDLPDYAYFFDRWGWKEKETCSIMDGFIQAKVFRRF
ncbi:class I SAM-dependent methyltransferase [Lunatibacter salilacus]|uniref:class I SAM-dependent methyltransferase n=1 Tax=Lunatibacter salilacus TaxID=2483804 RepID=UPI00131E6E30|nr:class I SAM-dependent methyltransferase [Lunatibacter salilacus]